MQISLFHRPAPIASCINVLVALSAVGVACTVDQVRLHAQYAGHLYSRDHLNATLRTLAAYGYVSRQQKGQAAWNGQYHNYLLTAPGRGALKLLGSAEDPRIRHGHGRALFPRYYPRGEKTPRMPSVEHRRQAHQLAMAWALK